MIKIMTTPSVFCTVRGKCLSKGVIKSIKRLKRSAKNNNTGNTGKGGDRAKSQKAKNLSQHRGSGRAHSRRWGSGLGGRGSPGRGRHSGSSAGKLTASSGSPPKCRRGHQRFPQGEPAPRPPGGRLANGQKRFQYIRDVHVQKLIVH